MSDFRISGSDDVSVSQGADRPHLLWAGRTVFDVVLGGEHTGGSLALLDQLGRQGDATPMHIHHDEAEIFYLIEGKISAWAGDVATNLAAGGAVYLPSGLPHAFRVETPLARLITITVPGGFADFVRTAGMSIEGDVPAAWEFDMARIMSAAARHGIEIVGPPPQS
jgi:quercetin dioxygenase-like cupin family protein